MLWIVPFIYVFISLAPSALKYNLMFGLMQSAETSLLFGMSFVMRSALGRILNAIIFLHQVKPACLKQPCQTSSKLIMLIYSLLFVCYLANIFEFILRRKSTDEIVRNAFFKIVEPKLLSVYTKKLTRILWNILACWSYAFVTFVPSSCFFLAYFAQLENLNIIRCCNYSIRADLKKEITFKKLSQIGNDYEDLTSAVKKVNDSISSLIVCLMGIWFVVICFSLYLILSQFSHLVRSMISLISLAVFTIQFIVFINVSNDVSKEIKSLEEDLTLEIERNSYLLVANLALLRSTFRRFRKKTSAVPFGLFKLEKSLILRMFGLIITYNIILFQFYENKPEIPIIGDISNVSSN
ncbi:uncharacterized protein [Parasteatoda tepidariorum]|uniref:uncharacterized protein n=1 Tax=Parasteatoda tepidariorum TaxID=114398 RepID=UPI0039BCBDAC